MKDLKEQPFVVFMMALAGWTVEQLNEQPPHIIMGGLCAVQVEGEDLFNKATAADMVRAAAVAHAICGDTPPSYVKSEQPAKKSAFAERLESLQKQQKES